MKNNNCKYVVTEHGCATNSNDTQNLRFYAQPYDITASGFYFINEEEFSAKIGGIRNDYGQPVEEFEIQFIDGDRIDAELCKTIGIHQGNIVTIMDKLDEWDGDQKMRIIIAVGECGYIFDSAKDEPEDFEIDVYEVESILELTYRFVDDGLYGEIPPSLQYYIDYDAISRDLAVDYSETEIDGQNVVYRCG